MSDPRSNVTASPRPPPPCPGTNAAGALNPAASPGAVTVVEGPVAEIARHLRRLGEVLAPLAVREPQLHHLVRGVSALAQAAVDRGGTVESAEGPVGPGGGAPRGGGGPAAAAPA